MIDCCTITNPWCNIVMVPSICQYVTDEPLLCYSCNELYQMIGVFCILLPRQFDKLDMTPCQAYWPGVIMRTGWNQFALILRKNICIPMIKHFRCKFVVPNKSIFKCYQVFYIVQKENHLQYKYSVSHWHFDT